jgi:hypothetical protein
VMKHLKKQSSSREDHFPKTLFVLSRCRIIEDDGYGDLLSRLQMHVDERDEVVWVAQRRRRQNTRCIGGSWFSVFTRSVVAARIYREDMPMVIRSHNRLGLSLAKHIRHGLVAKVNGKRRSWTCEALGRILVDYSHARRVHAPAPIASPHHATPRPTWSGEVRRGERA